METFNFIDSTVKIWNDGGFLMPYLALLAFFIYFCTFYLFFYLQRRSFQSMDTNQWGHWIDRPQDGYGELGQIVQYLARNQGTTAQLRSAISEVRRDYLGSVPGLMKFSTVLISTAPLAGLLGTVIGMLKTFSGLATSSGSGASVVAGGIAEALITTQAGLVIAIPGFVLMSQIKNMRDDLDLFFIRLENAFVTHILHLSAPGARLTAGLSQK